MIEKQMKKLLTKDDLQKVYKIESYPLYYIDNNSPKKITYIPNHNVDNVEKKEWGTWHTISYEQCLNELNTLWHVGGTVILIYDDKPVKVNLEDLKRDYISTFVREVEKVKTNPIYKKYLTLEKYFLGDTTTVDYLLDVNDTKYMREVYPSYWGIIGKNDFGMHLHTLLSNPQDMAMSLIECNPHEDKRLKTYTNCEDMIRTRINIIKNSIIPKLSESIINAITYFIESWTYYINYKTHKRYENKSKNILNNKANYRPADRQKPIANSLRAYKSSPKRKSGLRQLENSVRRMF